MGTDYIYFWLENNSDKLIRIVQVWNNFLFFKNLINIFENWPNLKIYANTQRV